MSDKAVVLLGLLFFVGWVLGPSVGPWLWETIKQVFRR